MGGWLVKCDFITHSGSSDPSLDSESKLEPSVAKCPACQSVKAWKNIEIIVPPSTLILHLKRFTFENNTNAAKKLHVPISCPPVLSMKNETKYQLNAVINHMGETTSSGHYNILLHDKRHSRYIIVDDLEIRNNPVLDYILCYSVYKTVIR